MYIYICVFVYIFCICLYMYNIPSHNVAIISSFTVYLCIAIKPIAEDRNLASKMHFKYLTIIALLYICIDLGKCLFTQVPVRLNVYIN
jgi:hypothetical protein